MSEFQREMVVGVDPCVQVFKGRGRGRARGVSSDTLQHCITRLYESSF